MTGIRLRPRRLVLVGSIVVDVLLYVDRLPERGGDLLARQALAGAGGGFNVLLAATRLGMPAAFGVRTGTGVLGEQARLALRRSGIAALLPPDERADTGVVVGLVEPDGERTFVTVPGAESRLEPDELRALPLHAGDAVYVSGYDLVYPVSGGSLQEWLPALSPDLLLAIDTGPLVADIPAERLRQVLGRTDLLSVSAREAAMICGVLDPARAAAGGRHHRRRGHARGGLPRQALARRRAAAGGPGRQRGRLAVGGGGGLGHQPHRQGSPGRAGGPLNRRYSSTGLPSSSDRS